MNPPPMPNGASLDVVIQLDKFRRLHKAAMEHCATLNDQLVVGRAQFDEAQARIQELERINAILRAQLESTDPAPKSSSEPELPRPPAH